MTEVRTAILDTIVYELNGTCGSLDDVARENGIEELTIEDIEYIEGWIFLCDNCGWWCDVGEDMGCHICQDCYEEELEDD